jgi:hypothetical protein
LRFVSGPSSNLEWHVFNLCLDCLVREASSY